MKLRRKPSDLRRDRRLPRREHTSGQRGQCPRQADPGRSDFAASGPIDPGMVDLAPRRRRGRPAGGAGRADARSLALAPPRPLADHARSTSARHAAHQQGGQTQHGANVAGRRPGRRVRDVLNPAPNVALSSTRRWAMPVAGGIEHLDHDHKSGLIRGLLCIAATSTASRSGPWPATTYGRCTRPALRPPSSAALGATCSSRDGSPGGDGTRRSCRATRESPAVSTGTAALLRGFGPGVTGGHDSSGSAVA